MNFIKNITNPYILNICKKYEDKLIRKNKIDYFLRSSKMLKNELITFIKKKKYQAQSDLREIEYAIWWNNFDLYTYFNKPYTWHIYKDDYFLAPGSLTQEIFQSLISEQIDLKKPKSIIEIGCGMGINLLYFAEKYPNIKFTGIDISKVGIQRCNEKNKFSNLSFVIGNAKYMSFKSNTFDMSYTTLALEQMNEIKKDVIDNISKITKNNVIFIEPFMNNNKNFLNYVHHKNSDYFDYEYKDLKKHNFIIESIDDKFPQRLGLTASCVLLTKTKSGL
tara:strand:+ start:4629 stop:5459 length:831 start_codon:yes stop_codon:yes gene_type:complete